MGAYLVNDQFNNFVSKFKPQKLDDLDVTTWDGLLLFILENPLEFIVNNYETLNTALYKELIEHLNQSAWLKDKVALTRKLSDLRLLKKWELSKEIGDFYFDAYAFDKSMDHYIKFIESYQHYDQNKHEQQCLLGQVYANIGLVLMTIGEITDGIELMEYAYEINKSQSIFLKLLKFKLEFNMLEDLSVIETIVEDILTHPSKDENLGFLVWYYHFVGDFESSITSYMQIKNINLRFKLVDYYMVYMLESNQYIAMASFLKPLKEINSSLYNIELIHVYIEMGQYEEALHNLEKIDFPEDVTNEVHILRSKCHLGLKRIIESIRAINSVKVKSLKEQNRESYYVQLAKLSKYSKDFSKEYIYNQQLLNFWKQKYRKIYSGILYNTKWKVNK